MRVFRYATMLLARISVFGQMIVREYIRGPLKEFSLPMFLRSLEIIPI